MKFIETLRTLPLARQLMLAGAVLGVVFAMTYMVRGAMEPPMTLLYSGLDAERAGEIVNELEQRNVKYEVRQDAIFVSRAERDRVRLSLAQEGLPRQSVKGYELLDNVNGFSVTSEMYKASYWRAKEGELTRTVLAIPGVDAARVHIGANLRSGFTRTRAAPTASVTITATRDLSGGQAEAIQYLVALAVPGLNPSDVAVIDSRYGILVGPNVDSTAKIGALAESRASELEGKIMSMLEARLGSGNARVSVSVDVTREIERIAAVQFDPDSRVVRQRTVNDTNESKTGSNAGVTVASNLPNGDAGGAGGNNSSARNSSETVAYEFNETRTERERLPGEVRRISIAVLLNETALGLAPDTADLAAELQAVIDEFEQLITAGAGLDASRGDVVTVELMPFQAVEVEDLVVAPGVVSRLLEQHLWAAVQLLMLGVVAVVLGFGVIRPIFTSGRVTAAEQELAAITQAVAEAEAMDQEEDFILPEDSGLDTIQYLQDFTSERQEDAAALLQEWLRTDEKVSENKKVAVNE